MGREAQAHGYAAELRHRAARAVVRLALIMGVASVPLAGPVCAPASRLDSDTIAGVPLSSREITRTVAPDLRMRSGVLLGPEGRMLWARDEHRERPMASVTKMMTALIALEQCNPDEMVTVSSAAARVQDATGLIPGEQVTVRQLLELALVASSNDAAYALGEHVSGTMPAFVTLMNTRAKTLGLANTHFANAHGLDAKGHYSSAADLAFLARTAMALPEFRRIVSMRSVTLPARGKRTARRLDSTDDLLGHYRGLKGVKTGFTNDARYCFVASAERSGIVLTSVVLGTASSRARFAESARLLDWGFAHLALRSAAPPTGTVDAIPVSVNPAFRIPVSLAESASVSVFDLGGPVVRKISVPAPVKLPVFRGQPLGEVVFTQSGDELKRVGIVAAVEVASAGESVGSIPVTDYVDRSVVARAATITVGVSAFDPRQPVNRMVDLESEVSAPVEAGARVGEVVYSQNGRVLARVPVVAASSVRAPGLAARVGTWFARSWRLLTGQPAQARLVVGGA